MSAVSVRSLIATGTPCRAFSFARFFTARSASRAQASAFSAATVQKALTAGLILGIAARCASTTSTGLAFFVRTSRASSTAESRVSSLDMRWDSRNRDACGCRTSYTFPRRQTPQPAGTASRGPMGQPNQYELLKQRRFLPFFLTQFLGAFNDNVYKNALVILVAFHAASLSRLDANTLSNLAQAVFILPFFLFSATAGQIADKLEKSRLIRWVKLAEIAIMALGAMGLYWRSLSLLMTALFLMGLHSTVFGPVKYAYLPQHLDQEEIVGGNGLVEMGTFLAILVGTLDRKSV